MATERHLTDWNLLVMKFIENKAKLLETLMSLSSDEERISFCFNNKNIESTIENWIQEAKDFTTNECCKSKKYFEDYREKGNQYFAQKSYGEAIECYTKALLYLPTIGMDCDSQALPLIYSNRSAAFYFDRKYETCLRDIDWALKFNCSNNLKLKLLTRKAKCYYYLSDYDHFTEATQTTLTFAHIEIEVMETSFGKRVIQELKDLTAKVGSNKLCKVNANKELESLPAVSHGLNPNIDSASEAIDVQYCIAKGRHLVANRNIKTSDVLFAEKPFASVLLPKFNDTHCHHCYKFLEAPFPCKCCSVVRYCSQECRDLSHSSYHKLECQWLPLLYKTGILHLVMRIVAISGISYLLKNMSELKAYQNLTGLELCKKPTNSYYAVYSLVTNSHLVQPKDMFYYSLTSVLLTKLLDEEITKYTNEDAAKYFIGSVILRHIQQLICNANAITALIKEPSHDGNSDIENEIQERIATAVYPSTSLMNHSCEPNIITSFRGDVIIVKAACDIATGQEIYNCYGPHYLRMSKVKRQEALLQQYFFTCDCCRCSQEVDRVLLFEAFKCRTCKGPVVKDRKCSQCDLTCNNYSEFVDKYSISKAMFCDASSLFEQDKVQEALDVIFKCLDIQQTILYKFHPQLLQSMDLAAKICAMMGIFDKSAEILRQTLIITEEIFGSCSIELANELQKFTDVLSKLISLFQIKRKSDVAYIRSKCNEALTYLKKGMSTFETLYGIDHESFKEMTNKYNYLYEMDKEIELLERQENAKLFT